MTGLCLEHESLAKIVQTLTAYHVISCVSDASKEPFPIPAL